MTNPNSNPAGPWQNPQQPAPNGTQQPQYGAPQYGQPAGSPYGAPQYGAPQYGAPAQPGQPLPQGMPVYANAGFGPQGPQGPQVWYQPGNPPLDQPWYGIGFGRAIGRFFRKYAVFSGRASRGEFWWVMLFLVLVSMAMDMVLSPLSLLTGSLAQTVVNTLWTVAIIVPMASLFVRRLHDSNKSGWWLLLPGIPYVICQAWDLFISPRLNALAGAQLRSLLSSIDSGSDADTVAQSYELVRHISDILSPGLVTATGFISLMGLTWLISTLVLSLARTNPAGVRFDAR